MAAHRYWRLYITEGNTAPSVRVGEMELRVAADGTGASASVTGNGTASADSSGGGAASQAFDADIGSTWGNGGTGVPNWLKWDFGAGNAHDIKHLTLKNPNNADAGAAPQVAELQWSDNDSTWTKILDVAAHPSTYNYVGTYLLPASATVDITFSAPTVIGYTGGAATATFSSPTLSAYCGGAAATAMPSPTVIALGGGIAALVMTNVPYVTANGHDSTGENGFSGAMPSATLSAQGGASAALAMPSPTLAITATVVNLGHAAITAPGAVIVASGTRTSIGGADLTFGFSNGGTYDLIGYSGALCSVTIGSVTLAATGTTGGIGNAALAFKLFELTASGTEQNFGGADLLCPSPALGATVQAWIAAPSARLVAIGTATVAVTYEAYALNLNHKPRGSEQSAEEMTRYTNYPFDRIVRYKDSYYGMNSTGLYLLEGTTDDATPISWSFKTCMSDFGTEYKKTVDSAYFGGRLGNAATVSLYVGEIDTNTYNYTATNGPTAQNYRQKFGRGAKARYFALGASGTDTMKLDSITLEVVKLTARI